MYIHVLVNAIFNLLSVSNGEEINGQQTTEKLKGINRKQKLKS